GANPGPSTATRRPTGTATRSPASKPPPAPAPNGTCGSSTGRRAPPATTPAGGSTPTATKPSPATTSQTRRPDDPHQRALHRLRAQPDDHRRVHPLLRRRPRTPAVRHHPPPPSRAQGGPPVQRSDVPLIVLDLRQAALRLAHPCHCGHRDCTIGDHLWRSTLDMRPGPRATTTDPRVTGSAAAVGQPPGPKLDP